MLVAPGGAVKDRDMQMKTRWPAAPSPPPATGGPLRDQFSATCRILSLLLFGVLSLSPLLVVTQRPPSGLGSTVRSRPNWPWKNACGAEVPVPWIFTTHSRVPRKAAMYSVLLTTASPLGEAEATGQGRLGAMKPAQV